MKKYYVLLILAFISLQCNAQYFAISEYKGKDQFNREFVFPVVSLEMNSIAADRINNIIQLDLLNCNYKTDRDSLFNNLSEDGSHGVTKINYEITSNTDLIFSIVFEIVTYAAYEDTHKYAYNFISKTGKFLDFNSVFNRDQMNWIYTKAKHQFNQSAIEIIKSDYLYSIETGKLLQDEVFSSYAAIFDCIYKTEFYNFYIKDNYVVFDRDNCFNRGSRAFEPNFSYKLDLDKTSNSIFTEQGQYILSENLDHKNWRHAINSSRLILTGLIDSKYSFVMTVNKSTDLNNYYGSYWYTKHGKEIELRGQIDDIGDLILKEENGMFRFECENGWIKSHGIWSDNKGNRYNVSLE